jgi:hypothetical protein
MHPPIKQGDEIKQKKKKESRIKQKDVISV